MVAKASNIVSRNLVVFIMRFVLMIFVFYSLLSCKGEDQVISPVDKGIDSKNEIQKIIDDHIPLTHTINLNEDTLTFLALGDSYTIGSGVKEENRWPNQLASSLTAINITVRKPNIIARSGWTTTNLYQQLQSSNLVEKYDMVSLLIGVNNQYQGVPFSTFQTEFIELLKFSLETAKSKSSVFVLSIPDYGVTPFGGGREYITKEINMYNTWISEVCSSNKIKFYNITDLSRKAESDLSLLAPDQLHPSGNMYGEWVNLITNDLPDVLKQ